MHGPALAVKGNPTPYLSQSFPNLGEEIPKPPSPWNHDDDPCSRSFLLSDLLLLFPPPAPADCLLIHSQYYHYTMGSTYSIVALAQWYREGNAQYGKAGYLKAAATWDPTDLEVDMKGKTIVITGANKVST